MVSDLKIQRQDGGKAVPTGGNESPPVPPKADLEKIICRGNAHDIRMMHSKGFHTISTRA